MTFKWIREDQETSFGLIKRGDIVDTEEKGIPDEVAKKWIKDKWAKEIKPEKKEKS